MMIGFLGERVLYPTIVKVPWNVLSLSPYLKSVNKATAFCSRVSLPTILALSLKVHSDSEYVPLPISNEIPKPLPRW